MTWCFNGFRVLTVTYILFRFLVLYIGSFVINWRCLWHRMWSSDFRRLCERLLLIQLLFLQDSCRLVSEYAKQVVLGTTLTHHTCESVCVAELNNIEIVPCGVSCRVRTLIRLLSAPVGLHTHTAQSSTIILPNHTKIILWLYKVFCRTNSLAESRGEAT